VKTKAPPPGVQVIDLDKDAPAGPTPIRPTTTDTSIPNTILQDASLALTEPLCPPIPQDASPVLTELAPLCPPTPQDALPAPTETVPLCPSTTQDPPWPPSVPTEPVPLCPPTTQDPPPVPTEPAPLHPLTQSSPPATNMPPSTTALAPAPIACVSVPTPQVNNTTPQLSVISSVGEQSGQCRVSDSFTVSQHILTDPLYFS